MSRTRGPSVKRGLLLKSREAALNAVQTFNNPLTTFRSETFIVLTIIAWVYLLHAYYRCEGVEYRYYEPGPKQRRFRRFKSGAFKYWELASCLKAQACPLDGTTKSNLQFLVGLRNEIEHHQSAGVDEHFSGRYLACCLNYERYVCELFGERHSLGDVAAFTLQFRDLKRVATSQEAMAPLPSNVAKYVQEFDAQLSDEEISSPRFRCRFLFVPIITNKRAQADKVVQFVPFDTDLGKSINEQYQQVILKTVERPKHQARKIVKLMQEEGYVRFNMYRFVQLWRKLDAKNPGKGFGVMVATTWYWYDRWVDEVRNHCEANRQLYGVDRNSATDE